MALIYNHQVAIKCRHDFFELKIIINYFKNRNKTDNPEIISGDGGWFFRKWKVIRSRLNAENEEIINNLLKEAFKLKNVNKLDEDYIAVHIRSGDIFYSPHPNYTPAPLSYFTYILNQKVYKKIILVSEDRRNPITNELLRLYDNAEHKKNSLKKDLNILLGATNVIGGQGTFLNVLAFSENLKICFRPSMFKEELKDFFKINSPWRNVKRQVKNIFDYDFNSYMIGKKLESFLPIKQLENNLEQSEIVINQVSLEEIKQKEDSELEQLEVTKKSKI